jgi:hypothetical protein
VFLLSPANCSGKRAKQVVSPKASFALAAELRSPAGAPIGEVFAFVSGLYFRGKLRYATRFAAPPEAGNAIVDCGVQVITPNAGLRSVHTRIDCNAIRKFAASDVSLDNPAYRRPLERSAKTLARELGPDCDVVLLGSIASPNYVDLLQDVFGSRLRFPIDFVGRGDMSRGGLLLRMADAGTELDYAPVAGTVRHGVRPPKLAPLARQHSQVT